MKQLQNICKKKQIQVKYGLNVFDNLIIWIYDADMGKHRAAHSTVEYYCIWIFIEHLIQNRKNINYLKTNESLFYLMNEFWYDHWNQERKFKDKIFTLKNVMGYLKKKKETAIFGSGFRAEYLLRDFLCITQNNPFNIKCAIDNDLKKRGTNFQGLQVLHPSDISSWEDMYIIITTDRDTKEIREQLEQIGLCYEEDFILYGDIY